MNKEILHICAREPYTETVKDLFFKSVEEAQQQNPTFKDFRVIGIKRF